MRYIFIILSILIALGSLATIMFLMVREPLVNEEPAPVSSEFPEARPATPESNSLKVTGRSGKDVSIHDIRKDRETTNSAIFEEEGRRYVFAFRERGGSHGGYQLLYIEGMDEFQMTLFGEPLATTRTVAEQELLSRLLIAEREACDLRVTVRALDDIRPELNGQELGLSFCPGSRVFTD